MAEEVKENIQTLGFTQHIDAPTHRNNSIDTILDQCWINCPRQMIDTSVVLQGSSDHNLVVAKMRGKVQSTEEDYKIKKILEEVLKRIVGTKSEKLQLV